MKLTVLGSVSPYCFKDKNGIGFLLQNENENILIDCGSGISKNLDIPNNLNNLTIIISHLHRDHFCELLPLSYASLIYSKNKLINSKIKVYIPNDSKEEIKSYVESLTEDSFFEFISYDETTKLNIGNIDISFKESKHGNTLTYHMKFKNNDKVICYSADTGFNENNLEEFSKNANLLICETTYLNNQPKYKDVHLTTKEAGIIAKRANVEKLMICHFWPNIGKELYLKETKEEFMNTVVANENEEFNF